MLLFRTLTIDTLLWAVLFNCLQYHLFSDVLDVLRDLDETSKRKVDVLQPFFV